MQTAGHLAGETGLSRHFRSPQVIENGSKEEITFSLCGEKIPWKKFFEVPAVI